MLIWTYTSCALLRHFLHHLGVATTPRIQRWVISLLVFSVFLSACAQPTASSTPQSTAEPKNTQPPQDNATPTNTPTPAATATVWPPVFDPEAIGDNSQLNSFIFIYEDVEQSNGVTKTYSQTTGYIREPLAAYSLFTCTNPVGNCRQGAEYLIDGVIYQFASEYRFVQLRPDFSAYGSDHYDFAFFGDMRRWSLLLSDKLLATADFVGAEDYEGIPVNRFAFDETDLVIPDEFYLNMFMQAEGEIILSQEGNYPLYMHRKLTGTDGSTNDLTAQLTAINQLAEPPPAEFNLPEDFPKVVLDPGFPLPEGSYLDFIALEFEPGVDLYDAYIPSSFTVTDDKFFGFYENLAPSNGWTVTEIGSSGVSLARGEERAFINFEKGFGCIHESFFMSPNFVCRIVEYRK